MTRLSDLIAKGKSVKQGAVDSASYELFEWLGGVAKDFEIECVGAEQWEISPVLPKKRRFEKAVTMPTITVRRFERGQKGYLFTASRHGTIHVESVEEDAFAEWLYKVIGERYSET